MIAPKLSNIIEEQSKETLFLFKILSKYFNYFKSQYKILHIAGANKTGKSIIIKDFILHDLKKTDRNYYYIDTENKFSKNFYLRNIKNSIENNRINRIFKTNSNSFDKLQNILKILKSKIYPIKPGDIIIIDSISELLKNSITQAQDYADYKFTLHRFTSDILSQLISFGIKQKIYYIFSHHVYYNPTYESNVPYYYNIMQNIKGMWFFLSRKVIGESKKTGGFEYENELVLTYSKTTKSKNYQKDERIKTIKKSWNYEINKGCFQIL